MSTAPHSATAPASRHASPPSSQERKPVRILVVSHSALLNGAQLSLLDLLTHMDRNRFEPHVVAANEGPLNDRLRALGIPVHVRSIQHWVAFGGRRDWPYRRRLLSTVRGLRERVWAIARLIERHGIDLVYTNTVTALEGALAARITRKPHIWHLREKISGNKDLSPLAPQAMISRAIGTLSTLVIANSEDTAHAYDYPGLRHKFKVIYNGLNLQPFHSVPSQPPSLREEIGIPDHVQVVSIIGMLIPRKGLSVFIQAAEKIRSAFPQVAFLIVGEGAQHHLQDLKTQVAATSLSNCIHFLGRRQDVDRILRGSNLMVIASEQETFGRTAVEAMAAAVPVVSTKCGGPEEIVLDGETGYLVPVNDPAALAQAALRILGNAELAQRMGTAGRARAQELFSLPTYVSKMEHAFETATTAYGKQS